MMFHAKHAARRFPGRVLWICGLALVMGSVLWLSLERPQSVAQAPAARPSATVDPIAVPADVTSSPSSAAPVAESSTPQLATPAWPASLRDSVPDGAVTLDGGGRVIASNDLRRLFDYFLSATGEVDAATIRALLLDHVRSRHGDAVAAEVAAQFDRYVDYLHAAANLGELPNEDLRARFERLQKLRVSMLDAATAEAYFGDEQRYTEYTLDRRDLIADAALDDATRQTRLDALDATLSPEQRNSRREAVAAQLVDEQSRQFDALAIDPAQRQHERAALFGDEAARRLAEADAERAAWDARVASYVQARNALQTDPRLTPAQRASAIATLRARGFDANEQRRISSLEAIGQL